jgi:hypothetical protein
VLSDLKILYFNLLCVLPAVPVLFTDAVAFVVSAGAVVPAGATTGLALGSLSGNET